MVLIHPGLMAGNRNTYKLGVILQDPKYSFNRCLVFLYNFKYKISYGSLEHLEKNGIIDRKVFPTVPVTVKYYLTEKGKVFDKVLEEGNKEELSPEYREKELPDPKKSINEILFTK
jgi:predicted transcriptional regulator